MDLVRASLEAVAGKALGKVEAQTAAAVATALGCSDQAAVEVMGRARAGAALALVKGLVAMALANKATVEEDNRRMANQGREGGAVPAPAMEGAMLAR